MTFWSPKNLLVSDLADHLQFLFLAPALQNSNITETLLQVGDNLKKDLVPFLHAGHFESFYICRFACKHPSLVDLEPCLSCCLVKSSIYNQVGPFWQGQSGFRLKCTDIYLNLTIASSLKKKCEHTFVFVSGSFIVLRAWVCLPSALTGFLGKQEVLF